MDTPTHYITERLTTDQVRAVLEVMFELEMQLPSHDPRWSELRAVRRVLGRMLVIAEPGTSAAAPGNGNGKMAEWPTREEVFLRSRQPARLVAG